jgi:hypothetical protein
MPAAKTQQAKKEKTFNEGNLAEAVLGAAIVAKIVLRQPNGKIGRVTSVDVKKVLQQMRKVKGISKGGKKTQIKLDSGGTAKDRITFYLNLGNSTTEALLKMKDLTPLTRVCDAAASYANSMRMEGLAESLYNNQINNTIEIDVDGISDNKGTKSDIAIFTDNHVFDKISLKAGKMKTGHSLGQIGGNSWSSILRLFHEGPNPKTGQHEAGMGLPINTKLNETHYMKLVTEKPTFQTVGVAVRWAYTLADDTFNRMPRTTLAQSIYKFLKFHSTRNDTDVKIVMLHLGGHKTLDPLLLEGALKQVNLKAITRMDTRWPVMLVYDTSIGNAPTTKYSSNVLFGVRPRIDPRTTGYITHLVEEGPRFSAILDYDVWYGGTVMEEKV